MRSSRCMNSVSITGSSVVVVVVVIAVASERLEPPRTALMLMLENFRSNFFGDCINLGDVRLALLSVSSDMVLSWEEASLRNSVNAERRGKVLLDNDVLLSSRFRPSSPSERSVEKFFLLEWETNGDEGRVKEYRVGLRYRVEDAGEMTRSPRKWRSIRRGCSILVPLAIL